MNQEQVNEYGMSPYQQFIHTSRYARYLWDEGRRETWPETIDRYVDFFEDHLAENNNYTLTDEEKEKIRTEILFQNVMPSMRCLMTAGKALKLENLAGYNCAYVAVDRVRAFDEILYILMCGTGVGFSVERQFVAKLPNIAEEFYDSDTTIVISDSKMGWAKAYKELISLLYAGQIPKVDDSLLRPAGSPLKTFGGRSSGPEPLRELFRFTIELFKQAAGRKLTSIECHDLVCKIASIVVVGGVRRSALISLSNLSDDRMRAAKTGQWWEHEGQRALSNNSAAYTEKPEMGIFMKEWLSLYESKSGERGIFNREACKKIVARLGDRRDPNYDFGTNPCSEIILRSRELCNLSEVVCRSDDTLETLKEKVRMATILGTLQSTLTNFKYVSKEWANNCNEERLLGVSLTGIMDCKLFTDGIPGVSECRYTDWHDYEQEIGEILEELKNVAVETNKEWAKKLGIPPSAAITCVKPSGTVSQLVDSSSGIHTRHDPFYIRTVRADKKDPLAQFMAAKGFPHEDDLSNPDHNFVFSFPVKSPEDSVYRSDLTALDQLKIWLIIQKHWCEHKPSITISVKEDEWMAVGAWVYENFDWMSGVSFLPYDGGNYKQAPYQTCTDETYARMLDLIPSDVDWKNLTEYEEGDQTEGSQTVACAAGACEIVDLT